MMREKDIDGFFKFILKHFQLFLQKTILSVNFFLKNELLNHAGAAAFFFLLSVTPVFLLLLISFDRYLISFPDVSVNFFAFLKSINENLDKDLLVRIGLLNVKTTAIGIFSLINLLWAGRSILTSIQRGLGIIFSAEKIRTPLAMNIFSFIILFFLLLLSVMATFISMGLNFFQTFAADSFIVHALFQTLVPVIRRFVPLLVTFIVIFLSYRFIPPQRPKTVSSLIGALWCSLSIILLHMLLSKFFNVAQYNVIYGVLGSLILMVIWIYISFVLFFFFAEYTLVSDKIDILLLERLYIFKLNQDIKEKKIEKFLFSHPKRLFEKYARRYQPGEILFRENDESTDIYFIYLGSIDIRRKFNENEKKIATLKEGEVFGEMSYLLNENRSATAVAETESKLIVITPDIFEELLQANNTFSRNLIQLLSNRLRNTHLPKTP
jgi:membrane protein